MRLSANAAYQGVLGNSGAANQSNITAEEYLLYEQLQSPNGTGNSNYKDMPGQDQTYQPLNDVILQKNESENKLTKENSQEVQSKDISEEPYYL